MYYLPGSHDGDEAWLDERSESTAASKKDFRLHAGEALFFNSSASLHHFTDLGPVSAAYSMRLTTLTAVADDPEFSVLLLLPLALVTKKRKRHSRSSRVVGKEGPPSLRSGPCAFCR